MIQLRVLRKYQFGFNVWNQVTKTKHFIYGFITHRFLTTKQITKNLTCISQADKLIIDKNSFRIVEGGKKSLLILLCWLLAKRKHYMKFTDFYLQQGFDVITVTITPWQMIWPRTGSRLVAAHLLKFMYANQNHYDKFLIHGFSVGGYVWGEVLTHIHDDLEKNRKVVNNIVGQIWDSAADITEVTIGTPKAIFPNNPRLQVLLQKYLEFHLKTFQKQTTQCYIRASQLFHANIVRTPALFLISNTDPVGSLSTNLILKNDWDSLGVQTHMKIFEKSPHVGHFMKHPKEYITELREFLAKLKLIQDEEKIEQYLRARLRN